MYIRAARFDLLCWQKATYPREKQQDICCRKIFFLSREKFYYLGESLGIRISIDYLWKIFLLGVYLYTCKGLSIMPSSVSSACCRRNLLTQLYRVVRVRTRFPLTSSLTLRPSRDDKKKTSSSARPSRPSTIRHQIVRNRCTACSEIF